MQQPNRAPRKARRTGSGHNTRSLYRLHTRLSMVAGGGTSTSPTCSSSLILLLLLLLLSSLTSPSSVQGGHDGGEEAKGNEMRHERAEQQQQQGPQPVERAIGLTRSASRWDTIRTWAKLACMNLRPPDSTSSLSLSRRILFIVTRLCYFRLSVIRGRGFRESKLYVVSLMMMICDIDDVM